MSLSEVDGITLSIGDLAKALRLALAREITDFHDLAQKFEDMLIAEVTREGGIPHLAPEEMAFRAAFADWAENRYGFPLIK